MKILSIETSCDETAVSILDAEGTVEKPQFKLLGNALHSQAKIHAKYGGVYPNLAKREHAKNLPPLLKVALTEAGLLKKLETNTSLPAETEKNVREMLTREEGCADEILALGREAARPHIDAIAVTFGPGLEPALWVGISVAKALGALWNIPVVPVNHMEGHVVSVLISHTSNELQTTSSLSFPALALLISGGHTELVVSEKPLVYKTIGKTRDDALGEAFDKVARMMELPYPGGPEVSKLAKQAREESPTKPIWNLPRPMIHSKDYDFSFSGLKTSVLYKIKSHGPMSETDKKTLAREFEDAVTEVILEKTRTAIKEYTPKSLIIGGGVIANTYIREAFENLAKEFPNLSLYIPEKDLATDNSVMIGMAGFLNIRNTPSLLDAPVAIRADGNATLG